MPGSVGRRWIAWVFSVLVVAFTAPVYASVPPPGPAQRAWLADHPVIHVGSLRKGFTPWAVEENGALHGIGADLLNAALGPIDVAWQPVWFDDVETLAAAVCKGQVDLAPDFVSTPGRVKCMSFGDSYFSPPTFRIVRRGDARFGSDDALAEARIAVPRGGATEELVRLRFPKAVLVPVASNLDALKTVTEHGADVYLGGALANAPWLDTMLSTGQLQLAGRSSLPIAHYSFAYAMQAKPLADLIEQRIALLDAPSRAQIVSRWVGVFARDDAGGANAPIGLDAAEHAYVRSLPTLGVGLDTDWTPLSYVDRNGVSIGVAPDYVAEINAALGTRTRRVNADTVAEARAALANGDAMMMMAIAPDTSLARELLLSQPYEVLPLVVAMRQQDHDIEGLADLGSRRVAVVDRPFQIGERLEAGDPALILHSYPYTNDALQALADGRVDAVVDTVSVLNQHIQRDFPGRLKIAGPTGITLRVSIGVAPSQARLLPLINRALANVSESRSQSIRARWITTSFSYGLPWPRILGVGLPLLLATLIVVMVTVRANRRLRLAVAAEQHARETAERATQAKAQFLAVMSHEIRTPMTSTMGMLDLLDRSELTEDQHDMVDIMRQSGHALLRIIDDLLDYSRFEAGQMPLEAAAFDPRELVDDVAGLLGPMARSKSLRLYVVVDAMVAPQLLGDSARLRQVLYNLAGNAIKFTHDGYVRIHVALLGGDEDAQQLRFGVEDTGIGIAADRQQAIFEAFAQEETSTNRRFGGTGLGLAIVRRIADLLGAELRLDSSPGRGTRFDFSLSLPVIAMPATVDARSYKVNVADPLLSVAVDHYLRALGLQPSAAADAVVAITIERNGIPADALLRLEHHGEGVSLPAFPLRMASLRRALRLLAGQADDAADEGFAPRPVPTRDDALAEGHLVLVVDDQRLILQLLIREMHLLGYTCDVAHDGNEALALMAKVAYGLVLTDCFMTGMDGFALIERARATGFEGPIMAMTASPSRAVVDRCLALGANQVLDKPIRLEVLQAAMARLLPLDTRGADSETLETAASVMAGWERHLGDDAPAFAAQLCSQVQLDLAAFDLALREGSTAGVAKVAHQYASIYGWASATRLRELCLRAEADAQDGVVDTPAIRQLHQALQSLAVWLGLRSVGGG